MNFRGPGNKTEPATTGGVHNLLHTIMESPDILEAVNARLAEMNHQAINYGQMNSGLVLHYLCHALGYDSGIYFRVEGEEFKAVSVSRRVDSIGRMDTAIVFDVEPV